MSVPLDTIGAALVVFSAAIGIGIIGHGAVTGVARQPEASQKIQNLTLVLAAMIEGVALFAVVICFVAVLGR